MNQIGPVEFSEFIKKEIHPLVEGVRTNSFFKIKKISIGIIIYVILTVIGFAAQNPALIFGFNFISVLKAFSMLTVFYFVYDGYSNKKSTQGFIRAEIIQKIIKLIDPTFQYSKKFNMYTPLFLESKLTYGAADRCYAEDRIFGVYNSTEFWLCQAKAETKIITYSERGSKQTRWLTMFTGLVFVAEFNKELKGHTIVKVESSSGIIDFLNRPLSIFGDLVNLENPEFEKKFKVFSTDQVEARYILTPNFMEKMVELTNTKNIEPSFAFYSKKMVMLIPMGRDFIDHQMNWDSVEVSIHNMIREIQFFISIIDDLNLNQKIWKNSINQGES